MKIERAKNASRNIIFGVFLRLYQIVVPFVIRTVMIYCMGIQYVGLNSLFTSILQVLNLVELGVGSAMVFSMYKPIADDDETTICALLKLYRTYYRIIGAVIAVVGILLTPLIPYLIKTDIPTGLNIYVLYWLSLSTTVLSYWLVAYKNSLFQAHQRIDVVSKITLAINTIFYILQVVIIVGLRDYYLYTLSMLFMQAVINIVTALAATKMYPNYKPYGRLERKEVKKINQRIKDLFTAKLGSVIVNSVDTIVISAFLGLTTLAIYQNYYFILSAVCGFLTIIFNSVLAGMGNSFAIESMEKNYNDFKRFSFIISWIICICCACFIGLYQPFIELWVGKELMLSMEMVILFCIYFYVCQLAMVWATVKDAAGMWHEDRMRPLVGATANLVMNLFLVNRIGLYGILLSTILSYVFISMPWLLRNLFTKLYKRSPIDYIKSIVMHIIATSLSCYLVYIICDKIEILGLLGLLVRGIICIVTSNIIQGVFFWKAPEFKQSIELVKRMLRG